MTLKVKPARLIDNPDGGDPVYFCARCPANLAVAMPPGWRDVPMVLVPRSFYVVLSDSREPGLTILTLPPRLKARLHNSGTPLSGRRRRSLNEQGKMPDPMADQVGYRLPVLMPCRRPKCGQLNRLDIEVDGGPPTVDT